MKLLVISRYLCVILFLSIFAHSAVAAQAPESFADLAETLTPAVVNISTSQKVSGSVGMLPGIPFDLPQGREFDPFREFFEQFGQPRGDGKNIPRREVHSLGSGFIISGDGYVVTNNHVIADAEEITVILQDDTKLDAKIIGRDSKTDLALLKVESKRSLPFVSFGDSDRVRVGDWVLAIGNPFGLGGTVTAGIISARSRHINAGPFDDFLQTDAAINRGNSGGPMFNVKGRVIGINTAIFSPSGGNVGIGFAVPAAIAEPVIKQLKEFGRTHRGWLGVKIQHVTEEIAESVGLDEAKGALVLEVNGDGPAKDAGIKAGDIILEFDGKAVKEMRNLPRIVAETKVGKEVDVVVWRDGRRKSFEVTLGELKEEEEQASSTFGNDKKGADNADEGVKLLGMRVSPLDKRLRNRFGVDDDIEGLVVLSVEPDGVAAESGFRRGDIITRAGSDEVEDVDDLRDALKKLERKGRSHALVRVLRGGDGLFLTLPTKVE